MAGTPWLTNEEARMWRAFIDVSSGVLHRVEGDLKADSQLGFDDYEVLVHLSEHPERQLRMSDLSERLVASKSGLTLRIDRLSKRGLVRREPCEHDKRSIFAVLTDEGLDTITRIAPNHVRSVRRHLLDALTVADVTSVADALQRATSAFDVDE
ncbi:MAG: MarR family transcriptional regulator [Acidimicrobiaceae bacterium]|jgi:DNA-binding MarR family transcriptional regulator|nr:MarR family transcriptional regulator [Acidimicrobiaceae bacterium]NCG36350.1 MarR family transcriptional regulator [Actinomycetota bacterium]